MNEGVYSIDPVHEEGEPHEEALYRPLMKDA